jgi:DNA-binding PadR family transcriptional regulator
VGLTLLQLLDRAIDAGGRNLTGKAVAGTGKEANPLLNEACSTGFLEKTGGKPPKYNLTPQGRATWEQQASPERRQQVRALEQERQRRNLVDFLEVVKKKPGKARTKTELACYPDTLRQDASERKLVEPGPKTNCYRLLPAGEELLQAEQPIEQHLERLRQSQKELAAQWRDAQQRVQHELQRLGGPAVQAAAADLANRGQQACVTFDQVVLIAV